MAGQGRILRPRLNIPQHRFITMPQRFKAFVAGFGILGRGSAARAS